jgi:hypothetical protein
MEILNSMRQQLIENLADALAEEGNQAQEYQELVKAIGNSIHKQIAQLTIDYLLEKAAEQPAQNPDVAFVDLLLSTCLSTVGDKAQYQVTKTIQRDWDESWKVSCKIGAYIVSQACKVKIGENDNGTQSNPILRIFRKAGRGGYYIRVPLALANPPNHRNHHNRRAGGLREVSQAAVWRKRNLDDRNNLCSASNGYSVNRPHSRRKLLKDRNDQQIPPESLIQAINRLQSCQWNINTELFQLLCRLRNSVDELPPSMKDTVKDFYTKKRLLLETFHSSDKVQQSFFIPYKIDHRGRIYSTEKHLFIGDPQGSDIDKALLHFSGKRPLGKDGYKWLCKYLATMRIPKSFQESIAWAEEKKAQIQRFIGEIHSTTDDAMLARRLCEFWRNFANECAGEEFTFLAACFEVVACWSYIQKGHRIENFESNLPIRIDGKCNGFQHVAALTRNKTIAQYTNVLVQNDGDKPQDFYQFISQKIYDVLNTNYHEQRHLLSNHNQKEFKNAIRAFATEINQLSNANRTADLINKCKSFLKTIEVAENLSHRLSRFFENHQNYEVSTDQVLQFLLKAISDSQNEIKHSLTAYFGKGWENDARFRKYVKTLLMILGYGSGLKNSEIRESTMEIFLGQTWQTARETHPTNSGLKLSLSKSLTDDFLDGAKIDPDKRRQADVFLELIDWKLDLEVGEFRSLIKSLTKVLNKLDSGVCFQTPDSWFIRFSGRKRKSKLRFNQFEDLPYRSVDGENNEPDPKMATFELVYRRYEYDYQKVDKKKKGNILLANYVHSLDAYHLRLILNAAAQDNFKGGLMAIHDNVGTHAGDMEQLHQIVLKKFEFIYKESPLKDLVRFYRQRLDWMKSGFVFRGDGSWEKAEELAGELTSILNRIEEQLNINVTWFDENNDKVSQYLFS